MDQTKTENTAACSEKPRWYLRPGAIVAAVLIAGPFAIPLIWMSPALNKTVKVLSIVLLIILTVWLTYQSVVLYKALSDEFRAIQEMLK